jgi:SAM-dependent methyltransferase
MQIRERRSTFRALMPDHPHHGHNHDQGVAGLLHYLALLPQMWRSELGREVVRSLAPRAGERVVDLGSGMGSATVIAARTGASVIAVDPTSYMRRILELRRRWQRDRAAIAVLAGAAESIPSADGSVDALWTVNTIHHWTDRAAAARELARVMRPGGRVLLVDEDLDDPAHPFHDRSRVRRKRHGHVFEEVDAEFLAASLVASGFASAQGSRTTLAGRPVKMVRGTR